MKKQKLPPGVNEERALSLIRLVILITSAVLVTAILFYPLFK